jgi:hypothetical protein
MLVTEQDMLHDSCCCSMHFEWLRPGDKKGIGFQMGSAVRYAALAQHNDAAAAAAAAAAGA